MDPAVVRARGAALAGEALGLLSGNLQSAMAEGGAAHAVRFCSERALSLTASVAANERIDVRRVSHRARNPANRATPEEEVVLDRFAVALAEGGSPEPVVLEREDGSVAFHAPILLFSPLCLKCHGDPEEEMDPGAKAVIRELYPDDQATGFKLGELRGMWRIDFAPGSLGPASSSR